MNKIISRIIYIIALLLICICSAFLAKYYLDSQYTQKEANILNEISIQEDNTNNNTVISEEKSTTVKTERMSKIKTLQKQNSDIIGWIEISGTKINYPVVQGKDNNYYLNHNYKKKFSVNGAIFLDKNYSWNTPDSNLLIYGHHSTFKDLLKYQNKKFFTSHPTIRFTTNSEDVDYEILAVFKSKVYYQSEKNVFRYYYFINAKNEEEYNDFVSNAKKPSLYDTGVDAKYGDQLLTLSTCSYHTKDGRFVIVAKKSDK